MKTKPIRFTDRDISADAGVETLIVCTGSEGDRGC
jgi:hypothetical protein